MNKPILLKPSGKDYLWGGRRLHDEFGKEINLFPLAETWECSTHPDGPSFAANGAYKGITLAEIIQNNPEYMGKKYAGQPELPVLIKLIDANKNLSIQVHPDDVFAKKHENGQRGKTEAWIVLDAAKDAKLIYGFNHDVNEEIVRKAIKDGSLIQHLNVIPVKKGDLFLIEAGMVHAIGKGVLLAEIQENSNITYRLYDYDRPDKNGKKRPLHIERALQTANLKSCGEPKQPLRVLKYKMGFASELLCRCQYFEISRIIVNTERRRKVLYEADEMSFRVILCINGCGTIHYGKESFDFYKGDCIFIPAGSVKMSIHGQAELIDVRG